MTGHNFYERFWKTKTHIPSPFLIESLQMRYRNMSTNIPTKEQKPFWKGRKPDFFVYFGQFSWSRIRIRIPIRIRIQDSQFNRIHADPDPQHWMAITSFSCFFLPLQARDDSWLRAAVWITDGPTYCRLAQDTRLAHFTWFSMLIYKLCKTALFTAVYLNTCFNSLCEFVEQCKIFLL